MNKKQLAGDSTQEAMVCEKANMLHADLKDIPGTSAESDNLRIVVGR